MARRERRILPFRIPFFRIFYSTTYTVLYFVCLVLLAITPGTLIFRCFQRSAYQYIIMIAGTYLLTAVVAIFLYSSRLYTNRTTLAGVGKAYIPIEEDELGKKIRNMIVQQLERSAVIAWEAKPRDLSPGIRVLDESMPSHTNGGQLEGKSTTIGTIVTIDAQFPPWGDVRHEGWSSPALSEQNKYPNIQYSTVIEELPNLLEAKAVSLAPTVTLPGNPDSKMVDPTILQLLSRPATMDMATYMQQLSYLGLIDMTLSGKKVLTLYEEARFSPRPTSDPKFDELMISFTLLLESMTALREDIINKIRARTGPSASTSTSNPYSHAPSRASTSSLRSLSPVTARTRLSRNLTPYTQQNESVESISSVLYHPSAVRSVYRTASHHSQSSTSMTSDLSAFSAAGSVIWRPDAREAG